MSSVKINNITIPVEIMRTPNELETGLMGREKLEGGMLFLLDKGFHTFWTKNCLFPIDIIFINNHKITKIYQNCKPSDEKNIYRFMGYGDKVLEINAMQSDLFNVGDYMFIQDM